MKILNLETNRIMINNLILLVFIILFSVPLTKIGAKEQISENSEACVSTSEFSYMEIPESSEVPVYPLSEEISISEYDMEIKRHSKIYNEKLVSIVKFLTGGEDTSGDYDVFRKNVLLLARLMNGEQGYDGVLPDRTVDELQIYTGRVAINRVLLEYSGAKTLEDVIFCSGQYACIDDGNFNKPLTRRAIRNAIFVLTGKYVTYFKKVPVNVIFQAEFHQGSRPDNWAKIHKTYFCYK